MTKLIYVELRRLTSARKSSAEMEFLSTRYHALKAKSFLPDTLESNEYEDLRHMIVGGWVNALHYHLQHDYESRVVFLTEDHGPYPALLENLGDDNIFLISVMSGNFLQARDAVAYIREKVPGAKVIVGGVHATFCPEETFSILGPDYMVVGEADEIITELICCASRGKPYRHAGVWNKDADNSRVGAVYARPSNFEWSWELHNKYSHQINRNLVNYVNTRSCPFNCHFCGIVKTKYEEMPPEKVVKQIALLRESYHSAWVHWETPCCFYDQGVAETILNGIKGMGIHFAGQHRIEQPTDQRKKLYRLAVDAGLDNLFVGIETVQDNVLNKMNKGNKGKLVEPCLKALNDVGITINSGWIIGIPGQSANDVRRDMDVAVNLISKGLMAAALPQYLEIYPGTKFWNNAEQFGIELSMDPESYDRITKDVVHSTRELSRDDIWTLYYEFLDAVKPAINATTNQ